ncbi:hypothetical protein GGS23DRAFT_452027 [Durotheca rogersii]|uniref:uncharacterized protein n=1 Tax=Durotheca rogersii TaxID=419775 RepID=UPI00221E8CEB|nr:uncharacterized protein GGS23DRAFT_452027 [Durotheca rogersii]KAI5864535.1 hypothetical protein GGS23DRAFT_452027 [Durotheca rogersii]
MSIIVGQEARAASPSDEDCHMSDVSLESHFFVRGGCKGGRARISAPGLDKFTGVGEMPANGKARTKLTISNFLIGQSLHATYPTFWPKYPAGQRCTHRGTQLNLSVLARPNRRRLVPARATGPRLRTSSRPACMGRLVSTCSPSCLAAPFSPSSPFSPCFTPASSSGPCSLLYLLRTHLAHSLYGDTRRCYRRHRKPPLFPREHSFATRVAIPRTECRARDHDEPAYASTRPCLPASRGSGR